VLHIAPHTLDLGFSTTQAASMVSIIGGVSILGRLLMGFASDRIGSKRGMAICFFMLAVSLAWLEITRELWGLYLFVFVCGFAHGGFFGMITPLSAELFGTKALGAILGVVFFCGTIGGSISPVITGLIFDVTGSYEWAFLILIVVSFAGFILSLLLNPRSIAGGKTQ